MPPIDKAGRQIAGLLTYNPGPGIYSRLERAIQAMPENVRSQELPGLLKRYKEGVPGWELRAADLDSVIAGRDVVPKEELLGAVRERSPVYTHGEVILGGRPQMVMDKSEGSWSQDYQFPDTGEVSRLGMGVSHGEPLYRDYSQGGKDYAELLLHQPKPTLIDFGSHWDQDTPNAVAHARYDTHGDALRINELQSDLGIHNRKAREAGSDAVGSDAEIISMYDRRESDASYIERMRGRGYEVARDYDGNWKVIGARDGQLPFPLEDAWADLLIKRMALEAARGGHRAIEVASPRAIADKVGGNIDNYEHFYGKVVPGALERLGRKMGGLTPDDVPVAVARVKDGAPQYETHQQLRDQFRAATGDEQPGPNFWRLYSGMRYDSLSPSEQAFTYDRFGGSHPVSQVDGGLPQEMYDYLHSLGLSPEEAQGITSHAMYLAPHNARSMHNAAMQEQLESAGNLTQAGAGKVGRRYLMSDEMRRRLIKEGVGAAVAGGLMSQDDLIERLGQ